MSDPIPLGDRMKLYEQPSTTRYAFKGQPLIARLDGRAFHTFCRGLERPYDIRLTNLMQLVMVNLLDEFGANVAYTQSDEITLAWHLPVESMMDFPFKGRFQKLDSVLASTAAALMNKNLGTAIPEKADLLPTFDCRSFVVPTLQEAYHMFLWRQQDAVKNSISMAAQSMYSHKQLQGLHGPEMLELMLVNKGVDWNEYPYFFKRGTFARRVKEERVLTPEQLEKIPENHRPTGPVMRSFIDTVDIWLAKQPDPVRTLFFGDPIAYGPHKPIETGLLKKSVMPGWKTIPGVLPTPDPWIWHKKPRTEIESGFPKPGESGTP